MAAEFNQRGFTQGTAKIGRAPGALPLFGHVLPMLRDPLQFFKSLHFCGDLVRIRIGPVKAVVVCDPELTHQILLNDRTFDKGGFFFDRGREIIGNGLATCAHSEHRRQRRLLQPAFHRTRITDYAPTMIRKITEVIGSWRDGQVLDVHDEMMKITGLVLAATMFAAMPPEVNERLLVEFATIETMLYRRMLMPPLLAKLPTPGKRRYDLARANLRQHVNRIITHYRSGGVDHHGDLMSMLLATRNSPDCPRGADEGLSDTEIHDQLVTFFLAGSETTAITLSWAVHLVAHHPEIEKRLHAEVDTVLAGATVTTKHVPALELTRNIVKETLRLYPPAWLLTRTTTTDTELGGQPIPAGTAIVYSPYLIHHRPDLYADPERFSPDRWPSEQASAIHHSGGYLPFAAGARKCIGHTFAMTEATLTLAAIVASWRLEPVSGQQVHPKAGPSLRPRGLRMRPMNRRRIDTSTRTS